MMMEERKLNVSRAVVMATELRVISITSMEHNKVVSPANQSLAKPNRGRPPKFTTDVYIPDQMNFVFHKMIP